MWLAQFFRVLQFFKIPKGLCGHTVLFCNNRCPIVPRVCFCNVLFENFYLPYTPLEIKRRFGWTCLHLLGLQINETGFCVIPTSWLSAVWHIFHPWRWRKHVRRKRR
jgi:hypothetical protein